MTDSAVHATEHLWRMMSDDLRGFLRRRLPNESIADDLLQETFLRIHRRRDSVRDEQSVTGWVYQIARNLVIDYYRKEGNREWDNDAPEVIDRSNAGAAADNINSTVGGWMRAAIDQLPETYCEAVRLSDLEGLSQQAVADRLSLSLTAAKSRIRRGRELLRGFLNECCAFDLDARGNFLDADQLGRCTVCDCSQPETTSTCCSGDQTSDGKCG